jgi:hypothetical protein
MWDDNLFRAVRVCMIAGALMLVASNAIAADLGELHRMFGVNIGAAMRPPAHLRSINGGTSCLCPDFCTANIPLLGAQGAISVRWKMDGGTCRADLMTLEGSSLNQPPQTIADLPADLFGSSPEQIIARYGEPRVVTEVAGGQLLYCGLVGDYRRADTETIPNDLIFTAFLFDAGRLHAIRIGMTGNCPMSAFIPAVG